jgi:hypothetical protein
VIAVGDRASAIAMLAGDDFVESAVLVAVT